MLRLTGIILLCLAVSVTGFLFRDKLRFRKKYLEQLLRFTEVCAEEMRCTRKNVFAILKEHGVKELSFFSRLNKENITDEASLHKILRSAGIEELDLLPVSDFLSRLGVSDMAGQAGHCEFFGAKFAGLLEEAKSDSHDKGRLFQNLFLLAGAALFIILI